MQKQAWGSKDLILSPHLVSRPYKSQDAGPADAAVRAGAGSRSRPSAARTCRIWRRRPRATWSGALPLPAHARRASQGTGPARRCQTRSRAAHTPSSSETGFQPVFHLSLHFDRLPGQFCRLLERLAGHYIEDWFQRSSPQGVTRSALGLPTRPVSGAILV